MGVPYLLPFSLALACTACVQGPAEPAGPPSVVLFVADDPWELTNLAGKPEASGELEDLRRQLDALLEQQADPLLDG